MSAPGLLSSGRTFAAEGAWTALADEPVPGVATLLLTEAALLDGWQLDDWLRLYTEDCIYWVPIRYDAEDPAAQVNLVFDNRTLLEDRVFRLQTGQVPSQDPPSRTVRGVDGVMTAPAGEPDDILVRSTFWLVEHRPRATRGYHGRLVHRLTRQDGRWRIRAKKVALLNSDDPLPSLTFLL